MNDQLNGILVINKPQNMTSHDVVAILRKKLKTKKIGHTGTLDPMATGVLPVCIGKATKIVDYLMERHKGYSCEMILGASTDTQDQWGKVVHTGDFSTITETQVRSTVMSFVGEIMQIPPMYSALKVNGAKLVDLARQGIEVERQPRKRHIFKIDNLSIKDNSIRFDVYCSKGTYIRTLCNDIGEELGCYGHMTALNRIYSEPFDLSEAIELEAVTLDSVDTHMKPIDSALVWMPGMSLPARKKMIAQISNGVKINLGDFAQGEELYYRVYMNEIFYGIAMRTEQGVFMKKLIVG